MSLLILENIIKEYSNQTVLNGVSLRVERNERLALVGPNGSGKTTLLKIAMGREYADAGSVIMARNIKVGYLSQDLKEAEGTGNSCENVLHFEKVYRLERELRSIERQMSGQYEQNSEGFQKLLRKYSRLMTKFEALDGYTVESKIKKILLGLGLRQESLDTPLSSLSGGERMRVAVARILLEEPDLLVLDEPTNHLDIRASEWFEGFLKKFEGGILFVSHDRYFLDRVATRVAELEKGTICVRSGSYSNYLHHKKQLEQYVSNEQKRLRWTIKQEKEKVQELKSKGKAKAYKSREKELAKLDRQLKEELQFTKKVQHLAKDTAPKIMLKKVKHVSKDIAWAENLSKSFGGLNLFSDACFHIKGGERVGIIGPNGSGKSTLIKMLIGKDKNYEGFLRLGEWVKYSYLGQEILFENEEETMLGLIEYHGGLQEEEARGYLARFQFYGDEVQKSIKVLSGGERVKLYLALIMLEEADCLILDEPTNHLDIAAKEAVERALQEFRGTIIAVTHDRYFLTKCINKLLEFDNGKITSYDGNYDFYKRLKFETEKHTDEAESRVQKAITVQNDCRQGDAAEKSREKESRDIEAQIADLENQVREMESSFNRDTPPEAYRKYQNLLKKIELLYSEWGNLIQ